MKTKTQERLMLKLEMKLALEEFKIKYKRVTSGIKNIYSEAMFSSDLKKLDKLHTRFFGYITKSLKAKKKLEDLENE